MGRKESNQTNKQQGKYKLTSEHEQEMPQSQIADQSMAPWGRDTGTQTGKNIRIIELFVLCKGGNFNIHIWAWFGYFIC